jgi:hypothetical protein
MIVRRLDANFKNSPWLLKEKAFYFSMQKGQ